MPLAFSLSATACASCGLTEIYAGFTPEDASMNVVLTSDSVDYSQVRDPEQLRQQYLEFLEENYNIDIPSSERTVTIGPVPDASIFFYYETYSVDSATGKLVSTRAQLECGGVAGPVKTDSNGVAKCKLDPSIFTGKCTRAYIQFQGTPSLNPATSSVQVCDSESDAFAAMASALSGISQASVGQPLCIVAFLILGLFIASMFFSGRSPLALLDITTPLLPKPKAISYSGMSFGTGYIRMRRELASRINISSSILKSQAAFLKSDLLRKGISLRDINEILTLAKGRPHIAYLALRALKEGKTMQEAKAIAGLNPGFGKGQKEEEFAEARKWIKLLQKGEKDKALDMLTDRFTAEMLDKEVGRITGNVPGKLANTLKTVLDHKYSPLKYMMPETIREQIRVGLGSAFFGGRSVVGVTKVAAKGLVRAGAAGLTALTGKQYNILPYTEEEKKARQFFLMDIRSRIEQFYNIQMQEAKANVAMYVTKRLLESKGVKFDLSEKELLGLGKIEILEKMNLKNNPKAAQLAAEISKILQSTDKMDEKIRLLRALAESSGASYDKVGVNSFLNKLASIDSSGSYRTKLQSLHDYLENKYEVHKLNSDFRGTGDNFYPWVGRHSFRYVVEGGTKYDDTWKFMFLRSFVEQNEKGQKGISLGDTAKVLWLRLVNEMWGLFPSDMKGLPTEQRLMMKQAEEYLLSLLSEKGKEILKNGLVLPSKFDENGNIIQEGKPIKMTSPLELLYNPTIAKSGLFVGQELAREMGADAAHWNVDMRGYWRTLVPGSSVLDFDNIGKTSVMEQAFGAAYRSHIGRNVSPEVFMKEQAREMFYNRIVSMIGSKYPDAYQTGRQEFRFLASTYGAFKERYAELYGLTPGRKKDSSWVTDDMVADLVKKGVGIDDLHKFVWIRTREGNYVPFTEGREGFGMRVSDGERIINGKFVYNAGSHWESFNSTKLREKYGRLLDLPAEKGGLLSASLFKEMKEIDNLVRASQQSTEGMFKKRELDPKLKERMVNFSNDVITWGGKTRRDAAAYIVFDLCKRVNDFSIVENSKFLSIQATKDVGSVGFRKFQEKVWLPFAKGAESLMISSFLPQLNELQNVTMLSEHLRARTAEYSARYAMSLADPTYPDKSINRELHSQMIDLMDSMNRYRSVWDSTITRDPRGNSSSFGPQLNFASFYHHGPARPFAPVTTLGEFSGRTLRQSLESLRMMPLTINWLIGEPFALMVRGAMTSMYGYPGKHDKTYHPLHPYAMTSSRPTDALRSLFDPFHAALDFSSGTFRKTAAMGLSMFHTAASPLTHSLDYVSGKMGESSIPGMGMASRALGWVSDVFKPETTMHANPEFYLPSYIQKSRVRELLGGDMTMREYGGKAMADGIVRTHEDHTWMYKNINVIWNVNTNPGISYIDFYYNMHADPRLASHLVSGSRYSSFFSQDNYLQQQANLGIVKRDVSAYELAEVRESEMRQYMSPRENRMWGLLNPISFLYNNPIFPLSIASWDFITHRSWEKFKDIKSSWSKRNEYAQTGGSQQFMSGVPIGPLSQTNYETFQSREIHPSEIENVAERWIRKTGNFFSSAFTYNTYAYCQVCGSPMPRGGTCSVCSGKSILLLWSKRKWARPPGASP